MGKVTHTGQLVGDTETSTEKKLSKAFDPHKVVERFEKGHPASVLPDAPLLEAAQAGGKPRDGSLAAKLKDC